MSQVLPLWPSNQGYSLSKETYVYNLGTLRMYYYRLLQKMHFAFIMKVEPHELITLICISFIFGVPKLRWTKCEQVFIFTTVFLGEGELKEEKYISSNDWLSRLVWESCILL